MEIQTGNCASILGTMESPKLLEGLYSLFNTKTIITAKAEQSHTFRHHLS